MGLDRRLTLIGPSNERCRRADQLQRFVGVFAVAGRSATKHNVCIELSEVLFVGPYLLLLNNQILDLKFKREAMKLATDRDQLIEQELVVRQLTYLMISMRQKLLAIPAKLYSRLGPERFPREAAQECERFIQEV